jgi:hypothetical protein
LLISFSRFLRPNLRSCCSSAVGPPKTRSKNEVLKLWSRLCHKHRRRLYNNNNSNSNLLKVLNSRSATFAPSISRRSTFLTFHVDIRSARDAGRCTSNARSCRESPPVRKYFFLNTYSNDSFIGVWEFYLIDLFSSLPNRTCWLNKLIKSWVLINSLTWSLVLSAFPTTFSGCEVTLCFLRMN